MYTSIKRGSWLASVIIAKGSIVRFTVLITVCNLMYFKVRKVGNHTPKVYFGVCKAGWGYMANHVVKNQKAIITLPIW